MDAPYGWTTIASLEDAGWTDALPANVSYQTGSFYNGSLYFVPTYLPGTDPANLANDLFRVDFTDPVTVADIVKVADMSGGTLAWNNNDDIAIDPATGVLYGRADLNDRDNNERTSYFYSYALESGSFAVISEKTLAYDYANPPTNPPAGDVFDIATSAEIIEGEFWGVRATGEIYRANLVTADTQLITAYVPTDLDGSVGGDWAGSEVTPTMADQTEFDENSTAVVVDAHSVDDNDAENSGLTYSLSGSEDDAVFDIDAATGEVTFKTAPDFEAPTDSDQNNVYQLTIQVCDSLNACATQPFTVTVRDVDEDNDSDGLMDSQEALLGTDRWNPDTDGDGLNDGAEVNTHGTDPLMADTDGEGLSDGDEVNTHGTDPLKADTDGEGLSDADEVNTHGTDPLKADTDGEGLSDAVEVNDAGTDPLKADTDGDGVSDAVEVGNDPTMPQDTDGDKTPDALDTDDDGDGVLTAAEAPDADGNLLPDDARDTDGDTVPDYLDVDDDGDGVPTSAEAPDANADGDPTDAQDTDGDTVPDYLDDNDDGDSQLTAAEDANTDGDSNPATEPTDTDGDGVPNYLDSNDQDGPLGDLDGDGLTNEQEDRRGDRS
ncbi:MAG: cadherin domain-containing protein [Thiolinea sp.]